MTPAEIEKLLADASLSLEIDNDVVCYKTQWIIDLARLALDQARELAAKDARIAECTAELLYLRYCHDAGYSGAKWAANDEKDLWRDKARAALKEQQP